MKVRLQTRQRGGRRLIAAAVAGVTVAGLVPVIAPAASATSALPAASQQTIAWGQCSWRSAGAPGPAVQCATITVPLDWDNPGSGQTLSLALSRTLATDQAHRKGVLFVNPGGPGGESITLPLLIAESQPSVAADYDIVTMDPRGVGFSTNLNCDVPNSILAESAHPAYDTRDVSAPAVAQRQALAKAIADACAQNPLTPYINTWQTVHDMDLIRQLLGEAKLNYLGYSYGSWLGAKYAAVFPDGAGKVVLDSNTAWMDDLANTWELMPASFQRRFDEQYSPWVARSKLFSPELGTTAAQVNASNEKVRAALLQYFQLHGAGQLGGAIWDNFVAQEMYTNSQWLLGTLFFGIFKVCIADTTPANWTPGAIFSCEINYLNNVVSRFGTDVPLQPVTDVKAGMAQLLGGQLPAQFYPTYPLAPSLAAAAAASTSSGSTTGNTTPINGVFYAVRCGDGGQWHSPSWWANYAAQVGPGDPLLGYSAGSEPCAYWSEPSHALPNPSDHNGPLVTVQAEFDSPTAYENTSRNVAQFHDARLIAVQDAGDHGEYGIRGNSCIDGIVNDYLLNDVLPAATTICGATPLLLENTVYPEPGPLDSKTPPKAVRAVINNQQASDQLAKLVG